MPCSNFQHLARRTWRLLAASRTASMPLKEESITDLIMLHLKLAIPHRVTIQVFNRRQEGLNGADWEWWFHHGSQWIGFRVQAKILDIRTEAYNHLHFQQPSTGLFQNDILIAQARNYPAKIPLYCLYTHTQDRGLLNRWNCNRFNARKHLYGCSLLSANMVHHLRLSGHNRLDQLHNFLMPWHCLVCCSRHGGGTPIERMNNYANSVFIQATNIITEIEYPAQQNFITDDPPYYVTQLVNQKVSDQLEVPDQYLAGVMVCSLEEAKNS